MAYEEDKSLKDGYARLGCIKKELGQTNEGLDYFKVNKKKNRLSKNRKAQFEYIKNNFI